MLLANKEIFMEILAMTKDGHIFEGKKKSHMYMIQDLPA